jgi:small conductance mechanosensitive channel
MTMERTIIGFLTGYAVRIAVAVVVMLIGRFLAGRARDFVRELLKRPNLDQALSATIEGMLVRVTYYGTLTIALVIALAILGVPAAAMLSVSSAILVVVAIALRESLSNFAATVVFTVYQPYRTGEEIETMGRRGIVREIQLFNTVLMQPDRSLAVLPNGEIQESGLINYTRLGIQRVDLAFPLKYDAAIEKARGIIMEIMQGDPRVLKDPPPAVVVMNMGDNGLEMQARPFVKYPDYDPVQFGFRQQITEALNAAGIELAIPQRDVYLNAPAPEAAATSEDDADTERA